MTKRVDWFHLMNNIIGTSVLIVTHFALSIPNLLASSSFASLLRVKHDSYCYLYTNRWIPYLTLLTELSRSLCYVNNCFRSRQRQRPRIMTIWAKY